MKTDLHLRSSFYQVNGIKIHVKEAGDFNAKTIIFLHGFPEFWYSWRKQVQYFLDRGFRVLIPDQRGYNHTEKPKNVDAYNSDYLTQDIVDLVKNYTTGKVHLVGHDWGAAIAWRIGIYFPEILHHLVIINVPHPLAMKDTLRSNIRQMFKSWYIGFFQIRKIPELFLRQGNFHLLKQTLTKTSLKGAFSDADILEYKKAWSEPGALKSMINWYRAAFKNRNAIQVSNSKLTVPVLILWGVKDLALIKSMAEKSVAYCENGRLILFKDNSHWLHHENPFEINKLILEFIEEEKNLRL